MTIACIICLYIYFFFFENCIVLQLYVSVYYNAMTATDIEWNIIDKENLSLCFYFKEYKRMNVCHHSVEEILNFTEHKESIYIRNF